MPNPFRLEFDPKPFETKIAIGDRIMLMGSCFTEHMYQRLETYKFKALQNPHGILFNPISIFKAIEYYIDDKRLNEQDVFQHLGLWRHWHFHSSIADHDIGKSIDQLNATIHSGADFLRKADWLFITLGSAFVYHLNGEMPVSNCHKMPLSNFEKKLMLPEEIITGFNQMLVNIRALNPKVKVMLTISPVRHLRDGFVENNRSKAVLIHAVNRLTLEHPDLLYFPAYELIIDDLRDYRFYAEDMVHPNYLATRYVWNKFIECAVEGSTREVMKELDEINTAFQHRTMHPGSNEHQKFLAKYLIKTAVLANRFPEMDLAKELNHFKASSNLNLN